MPNSGGERELFGVAHAYRAVYALRTDYDRQPILTVSAAIAYGELTLSFSSCPAPPGRSLSGRTFAVDPLSSDCP